MVLEGVVDAGRAPLGATAWSRAPLGATGEEDVDADRASLEATACPRPAWATGASAEVLIVGELEETACPIAGTCGSGAGGSWPASAPGSTRG